MSEFLAPLNYGRARDVLRRLSDYSAYTPKGAAQALDVLRESYPLTFEKLESKAFDNGAVLQVEAAFSLNMKEDTGSVQLFGTKGGARLSPELELYSEMNGFMTNVTPVCPPESFNFEFQEEINHFVHCLSTGEPCRSPAEDGVQIMRILDAVYESGRTGHEVIL